MENYLGNTVNVLVARTEDITHSDKDIGKYALMLQENQV